MADQIILRFISTQRDIGFEIGNKFISGFNRQIFRFTRAAKLIHGHHFMRPLQKLWRHLRRNTEEFRDHNHGNGRGKGLDEFNPPLRLKAVDQVMGELFNTGGQTLDLP